jgi:hypothetical protein
MRLARIFCMSSMPITDFPITTFEKEYISAHSMAAMSFSRSLPRIRASAAPGLSRRSYATTSSYVPLVYDLHEPAKPIADSKTQPIIVAHGLFGSMAIEGRIWKENIRIQGANLGINRQEE